MKTKTRFRVGVAVSSGLISALLGVPIAGATADGLTLQQPSVVPGPPPQFVVPPLVPPLRPAPVPDAGPKFVMPQSAPSPLPFTLPPPVIIKCGMTILHGDTTIDPKILIGKQLPANASNPVIGVMPAPACQE